MQKENKKYCKQIEIEIKARVSDKEKVLAVLNSIAEFKKKYFKKDFYYAKRESIKTNTIDIKELIRLRLENGSYTFCKKIRNIVNSTEVNEERELKFSKRRARDIIKFLDTILDYQLLIVKEKKGKSFKYKGALIELSSIKNLGDFVEIEIIEDDTSSIDLESRIRNLKNILSDIYLNENDIETRPYLDLFLNIDKKSDR